MNHETPDLTRRNLLQMVASASAVGMIDGLRAQRLLAHPSLPSAPFGGPAGPDRLSWRAHRTAGGEGTWQLEEIDGELPADLVGTMYRTAPGESERFGVTFNHLFDGDAFLSGWSFQDGEVTLRAAFLDHPARKKEQAAGKMLYGEFGTMPPLEKGERPRGSKNQPSVNVIPWRGQLLGLSEGGLPTAIDPKTLRYQGAYNFEKTLPGNIAFTAHPKFDPHVGSGTDTAYGYGIAKGPGLQLCVYRMEPSGKVTTLHKLPQPGFFMVHDMMITEQYVVFVIPPVTYEFMQLLSGRATPADALRYAEESPLRIVIVRKDGTGEPITIEQPAGMVFHHGNAYEQDGRIVLDTILSPDGEVLELLHQWSQDKLTVDAPNQVTRLVLDLEQQRVSSRTVLATQQEFPRFDERRLGKKLRYLYTGGRASKADALAFQGLCRHDLDAGTQSTLTCKPHQTVAEPVFVPRQPGTPGETPAAEDDGWILQLGYDGKRDRTFLDVIDAKAFERMARVWAPTHLPLGFHGNFARELFVEGA